MAVTCELVDKISLFLYQIYLNAQLKGSISEPQILVGGKSFLKKDGKESLQDLKKIIEDGITSVLQKILEE